MQRQLVSLLVSALQQGPLCVVAGGSWRTLRIAPATGSDVALAIDLHGWIHVATFDGENPSGSGDVA